MCHGSQSITRSFPLLVPTCRKNTQTWSHCLPESKIASAARYNKIQPHLLHTAKPCRDRQQCSPGEFESAVQGSREQQTICSSAKSQAPDLFTVDGDVLTALQVGQAHHLDTTTCHRRRVKQIIAKQHMHRTGYSMPELQSVLKPVVGWIYKLFDFLDKNCHKSFLNSNGNKAKSLRIPASKSKFSTSVTILAKRPAAL